MSRRKGTPYNPMCATIDFHLRHCRRHFPRQNPLDDRNILSAAIERRPTRNATIEPPRQDDCESNAISSAVPPVGCSSDNQGTIHMKRTPDKLPDPWLFDSEKLLRE